MSVKELKEMIQDGSFFISALSVVNDKRNTPCVIIYYLTQLVAVDELSVKKALKIFRRGKSELTYL